MYATLLVSGAALAQAPLDVTIRVLESPRDLPEAVTKTIDLPTPANKVTPEGVPPGHDRANEVRAGEPRQSGLDRAGPARPQGRDLSPPGRDFGQSIADKARKKGNGVGRGPDGRGRP